MIRKLILCLALTLAAAPASAWDRYDYSSRARDDFGYSFGSGRSSGYGGSDARIYSNDYGSGSGSYSGRVDRDGYARGWSLDSGTLRGHVDRDGYGTAYDSQGRSYRIRSRSW